MANTIPDFAMLPGRGRMQKKDGILIDDQSTVWRAVHDM
jgi:hypothetical protein